MNVKKRSFLAHIVNKSEETQYYNNRNRLFRRNGSYHRFFEGYNEKKLSRKDGSRNRIERVYIGRYYKRFCGDRTWYAFKVIYIVLYAAAAFLYIYALSRPAGSNRAWYSAAPGLISAIALVLTFERILSCVISARVMKIYERKYVFVRLFYVCLVTGLLLFLTAAACAVYTVLNPPAELLPEIVPCVCCLISSAAILSIGLIERSAKYEVIGKTEDFNQ
jgi:hypothetical protein